ncbi:MAG: PilZ domain-containing protein [Candidatus Omnitrophica bacterium]|nr:PilZ domain-containing protein [Candidatus Omnitrophota bacterium]
MSWDSRKRRKFVRAKFPCEITIYGPQKYTISTHAENISAGGIRFITKEKIAPASIVGLDLYGIKKEPIVCTGKVKWAFAKKDSSSQNNFLYDIGIEFSRIKEKDVVEIKKLLVSIVSGKETK